MLPSRIAYTLFIIWLVFLLIAATNENHSFLLRTSGRKGRTNLVICQKKRIF
jgi:hypothetical protein